MMILGIVYGIGIPTSHFKPWYIPSGRLSNNSGKLSFYSWLNMIKYVGTWNQFYSIAMFNSHVTDYHCVFSIDSWIFRSKPSIWINHHISGTWIKPLLGWLVPLIMDIFDHSSSEGEQRGAHNSPRSISQISTTYLMILPSHDGECVHLWSKIPVLSTNITPWSHL